MLQPKVNHCHLEALLLPWSSKEPMNGCQWLTERWSLPHHHPARKIRCLVPKSTSLALFLVGWKRLSILYYKNGRPHVILCPDLNSVESFSPLRSVLPFQWFWVCSSVVVMAFTCVTMLPLSNSRTFQVSPRWSFRSVTAVVLNLPNTETLSYTQFTLWWPQPLHCFCCYLITAILLLLRI